MYGWIFLLNKENRFKNIYSFGSVNYITGSRFLVGYEAHCSEVKGYMLASSFSFVLSPANTMKTWSWRQHKKGQYIRLDVETYHKVSARAGGHKRDAPLGQTLTWGKQRVISSSALYNENQPHISEWLTDNVLSLVFLQYLEGQSLAHTCLTAIHHNSNYQCMKPLNPFQMLLSAIGVEGWNIAVARKDWFSSPIRWMTT